MSTSIENVFDKISNEYYALTAAEKKAADYIMSHRGDTQFMSISELADASGVAEATISRFCRRLGYKGYNAFKLAVANSAAQTNTVSPLSGAVVSTDNFKDMCLKLYSADLGAMTETLELIKEESIVCAADLLEKAEKVICMGQGGSMILARETAHLFATAGGNYFAVEDSHMQAISAAMLTEKDVVIYFSYSGATLDMAQTMKTAKDRGAKIILITRYPKSPGASMSDVVLQCGTNENPLQLGSVAARIAQLFLIDVLFTELSRRNMARCKDARRRIADALSGKHL